MTAARTLPQSTKEFSSEIVRVTPKLATEWLSRNTRNRNINDRIVQKYARAMRAGEWMLTGEAVKFSANGDLLDGQHRLTAVFDAGTPITMLVIHGLPLAAQDVLDTGRARNAGDQLGIAGHADAYATAATARACILYEAGMLAERIEITNPEVLAFTSKNDAELHDAVRVGKTVGKGSGLRNSVAAMTYFELSRINKAKADEFFARLADGVELPAGSPILALRARLQNIKAERTAVPLHGLVSLVFRSWNAWRSHRSMASLPLHRNGQIIECPEPK